MMAAGTGRAASAAGPITELLSWRAKSVMMISFQLASMGAGGIDPARPSQAERGDDRQHENRAQQVERVAIGHDRGLLVNIAANRHDRLVAGIGGVGDAMGEEIAGELIEARTRR